MQALAGATRTWAMLSAWGGGLVLIALAAGAGGGVQFALAGLGIAALGWGGLSLRAGRILAPRAVLGVAVAALLGFGVLAMSGLISTADVSAAPLAAASVFIFVIAMFAALRVRSAAVASSATRSTTNRGAVDGRNSLLGLFGGAALVAALATPALAATEPGQLAVPHGEHGVVLITPEHSGH